MVAPAAAAQPSRPPASIEDFLWNIHRVLAQSGPLEIDQLKDTYSKQLGHKCAIERFLVVGEGGLAATLRRIPHIVSLSTDNGATYVKAFQKTDITKEQLIEADAVYRRELIKKNAAAKAKAQVGVKAVAAAPPKAQAPRPLEGQADAGAPDAKKPRTEGGNDAETLARMLIQGVVRVLQMRLKAGKGALPLSELEEEFKALWKVPFNLQQAGETDAVTFMQKWPHKVEVVDEGGTQMVQLSKKGQEKAKSPAPAKVAAAAKNGPAPTPSIPKRAGGPTRPPASIEDFLWNIHTVVDAFGGPMPIDQLKDAYSKHLGHKCAIERFLVVGEGGLAATLKRIPHIVSVVQEKDGATVLKAALPAGTTKEALIAADQQYRRQLQAKNQAAKEAAAKAKQPPPAGAAPAKQPPAAGAAPAKPPPAAPAVPAKAAAPPAAADGASAASTAATTPAAAAPPAAPSPATAVKPPPAAAPATVAGQKRPEAPAGGDTESAKKARTEEVDTLSRMLVQGVVRVLQNRQKEGKGSLPLANLEEEFKALWKVPFNLQQAGESDTVTFLKKWPNKVEIVTEGGQTAVQLAKKAGEKAKAAPPAVATPAATPAGAPPASAPTAVPPVKAAAPNVASKAAPPAPPLEAAVDVPAVVSANSSPAAAAPASAATPAGPPVAAGRAAAAPVPKEAAATPASAPPRQAPAAADRNDGAAQHAVPAEAKPLEVPTSLPELREQAADVLQTMRELLRRQEALVAGLQRLSSA